jgi:hypothetical protein
MHACACWVFWALMNYASQVEILWVEDVLPRYDWSPEYKMHLPSLCLLSISDSIDLLVVFLDHL